VFAKNITSLQKFSTIEDFSTSLIKIASAYKKYSMPQLKTTHLEYDFALRERRYNIWKKDITMEKIEKAFFKVVGMYCTSCKPIVTEE